MACFPNVSLFPHNRRPSFLPIITQLTPSSSSSFSSSSSSSSSSSCQYHLHNLRKEEDHNNEPIVVDGELLIRPTRTRRRTLNLSILTVIVSSSASVLSRCRAETEEEEEELLELERYTDSTQGFTLLRPISWIKVEKAGATVLFEDPRKGGNNVGVVVTPVRLTNLHDFGDPQFAANKLISAEKRKESTKEAEVISFKERAGQKDTPVYEFEYKVDGTRGGLKRIFSAAFVASKKLYLLNIAHSDNPQQPLSNDRRTILEQVLHSFDVVA